MVRRSRLEIYFEILEVIDRGIDKPTRIMYKTNLSWKPLQKILDSMVAQGLITEIASEEDSGDKRTTKIYKITQKGENTIKYFSRAKELLPLEEIAKD